MEYKDFGIEDFIMDESFQQYCIGTDDTAVEFWHNWILEHPEKQVAFDAAKKVNYILSGNNNAGNFIKDKVAFQALLASKGIIISYGSVDNTADKYAVNELQKIIHPLKPVRQIITFRRIAVAASILFIAGIGSYFLSTKNKNEIAAHSTTAPVIKNDIAPGSNKAILTLANGKTINLSDAGIGELAKEGGLSVTKTKDGQILFTGKQESFLNKTVITPLNKITTPAGGQYQILLADGTKVWLNAASSLAFPSSFTNSIERKVELAGEAYFEVKHDSKQPFRVQALGQITEDIGTAFNINSYTDETVIKTTLLEGSVKVMQLTPTKIDKNEAGETLLPGQQSSLNAAGIFKVYKVETEESIAWKNGEFMFNDEPLVSIMRKISRWYDVAIEYQDIEISNKKFGGTITRFGNVSEVLHMLELTKEVHFNIQGKKIIVSK